MKTINNVLEVITEENVYLDALKTCACCGAIIEDDDFVEIDGDLFCNDCVEYCYDCGEPMRPGEGFTTAHGNVVCRDCMESYYGVCEHCGDLISLDDLYYVEDYGYVCEPCLEYSENFRWSERRGEYVYRTMDLIKPYHWHKGQELRFYGVPENSLLNNAFVGLEWEIDYDDDPEDIAAAINELLGDRVYFEEDCSIEGCECIFMPHTFEELQRDEIREAFDTVKDMGGYNQYTGLHVHVSREAFGETVEEQNDNIAKLCILHKQGGAYDKMVALSRRSFDCEDWAAPFYWNNDDIESRAKSYVEGHCGSHGVAINCSNSATVEFRLGKGTVDYDEAMSWVNIIVMLVNKSKTISFEDAGNFDVWFEDADEDIKEYMMSMDVEWKAPKRLTREDYKAIMVKLMDRINTANVANGASEMDYNTMLYVIAGADEQTRSALGYM